MTVKLHCAGLFAPGSADLAARYLPTIDHIAEALKKLPGSLTVIGHTDNQPIHNLRFPSNLELSLARAETVRDRIGQILVAADHTRVDGLRDKEHTRPHQTAGRISARTGTSSGSANNATPAARMRLFRRV